MTFADLAPTPASYLKAARRIESESSDLGLLRLSVLSTFTAEFLRPYLIVEGAKRDLRLEPWFGPWGQLEEQASDAQSELYRSTSDVILILGRLDDLCRHATERFLSPTIDVTQVVAELTERLRALVSTIRRHTAVPVLLANFTPPARQAAGLADASLGSASQSALMNLANSGIAEVAGEAPDVFVLDLARVASELGTRQWTDPKLYYLARVPYSVPAQIAVAASIARTIRAAVRPAAKVLVLDLDNTLWGGVLGEDGIGGIALGDEYPGSVYKDFQRYLLTLKDRGILLAIASKNNPADVEEIWTNHRDCILRPTDFAAIRVNWDEKSANIRSIAEELNLGLDSVVFFDDSAFEREEVRKNLPAVRVLEVPVSPIGYIDAVESSEVFDRLTLSSEDRRRAEMYQQQAARKAEAQQIGSREEFLTSLQLVATIGEVGSEELPRVAQLLAKTNQFNLTTRRHSAAEIRRMQDAGAIALWLRLADRFGDNGLVGVAIARPHSPEAWMIDTFLLSCRVIGRGAETALLAELAGRVSQRSVEVQALLGEYIPTAKNAQVADFYSAHGFEPADSPGQFIRLLKRNGIPKEPPFIRIVQM